MGVGVGSGVGLAVGGGCVGREVSASWVGCGVGVVVAGRLTVGVGGRSRMEAGAHAADPIRPARTRAMTGKISILF